MKGKIDIKMRDPFGKIPIQLFQEGCKRYPALAKLFDKRIKRLVLTRDFTFFKLPCIYQWMIVGGYIAQQKLSILDNVLRFLSGIDVNLDKKIREMANWESNDYIFRLFTELLVIHSILKSNRTNFHYEESLQDSRKNFDINLYFQSLRLRIDVTCKEDKYPLEATAEKIKTNLRYASLNCGGKICYAAPSKQNYLDGSITNSQNMSEPEIIQTLKNVLNVMSNFPSENVIIPCPSPFFQIIINPNSLGWILKASDGAWNYPNVNGYAKAIQKKADKSKGIIDGSYKIIAVNFVPGSDFHDEPCYHDLQEKLLQYDLSTIDEVVTFSMRFENGKFENPKLLWKRKPNSESMFMKLIS